MATTDAVFRRLGPQLSAALFACWVLGLGSIGLAAGRLIVEDRRTKRPSLPPPAPSAPAAAHDQSESLPRLNGLSLDELQELARENNPTLVAAAGRMHAADGRRHQVGLYPNPVIGYQGTEIGADGTAGQQGGFIRQTFVTGKKLQWREAVAARNVDRLRYQYCVQVQRVETDVALRFYAAMVAQRRVELAEKLVSIGDEFVQKSDDLRSAMRISQASFLQAEIEAERTYVVLDTALQEQTEAWRRLTAVIGVEVAPSDLFGAFPLRPQIADWDACYAALLQSSPQLGAARARVEQAWLTIEREQRQVIPDLSLSVTVSRDTAANDQIADVQVGVPIPIFNANQGNISASRAEYVVAKKNVERLELQLKEQLAASFRDYETAHRRLRRYTERIVPRAVQSLELVRRGYQEGEIDYLTLLNTQRTYLNARIAELDALDAVSRSAMLIDGQLLRNSLTTTSNSLINNSQLSPPRR